MNLLRILMLFTLCVFANNATAYGSSSSSKKACKKPAFTEFTPPVSAEIPAQGDFSFAVSGATRPDSIKVTVKGQDVALKVAKVNNKYRVSGALPAALEGTHVRIKITATGSNACKGTGGWLLKLQQ